MGRDLPGYERASFEHENRVHEVYRAGDGPGVVIVHEVPGIHPGVLALAGRLRDEGFTVVLPSLFGHPGAPATGREIARSIARVCVGREFSLLADRTSPVVGWLRALAVDVHRDCGGPGVGAVGMCLTGGLALAMAVEGAVLAPVISQPGLPAPVTASRRAALGLDRADRARVRQRTGEGLCLLGLRFSADRASPAERFETLRRTFGDAFEGIEIDSSPGNPYGIPPRAHAVLTVDLVNRPGHPTRTALDRVVAFLRERLGTAGEPGPSRPG
jgi:dienelactone hydrolase